jgi:hypothetical protein
VEEALSEGQVKLLSYSGRFVGSVQLSSIFKED